MAEGPGKRRTQVDIGPRVGHRLEGREKRTVASRKEETGRTMSTMMPSGAAGLLEHRPFLFFLLSRSLSRFASQVGAVAIGWQVYELTGSAFDLGMIGFV